MMMPGMMPGMMPVVIAQVPQFIAVKDVDLQSHECFVTFEFKHARNLAMQSSSAPNPYVKLYTNGKEVFKTKYIKNSVNPDWNERVTVDQRAEAGHYRFEVWNNCTFIDDFMGFFAVERATIRVGAESTTEFQLCARPDHKADKVAGTVTVTIRAQCKPLADVVKQTLAGVDGANLMFVHLAPGVTGQHLFGVIQSIGMQSHFTVQQPTATSMSFSRMEEFQRTVNNNVSTNSYVNGRYQHGTATVSHVERWTEEFRATFAIYATSGGCQYLQVNYANSKGHTKFRNNWRGIASSVIQSLVASNLCNSNPELRTFVLSNDGAASRGTCDTQ